MTSGGRFDFDDGGTYCGSWEDGKALGYGVCTGPKGQGAYYGAYHNGFEICGVYKWTTGSAYKGQWTQGKRHGLGVESKGRWVYQGEWTQGFKGRYGSRQSSSTGAKYEGTWTTGLQDGYGVETYADGGTYSGQWLRGIRHGYGVRKSVPYGVATLGRQKAGRESLTSLRSENEEDQIVKERDRRMEEIRGGFVLSSKRSTSEVRHQGRGTDDHSNQRRSNSAEPGSKSNRAKATLRRAFEGLRLRKQRSEEFDNEANLGNSPSSTAEGRRFTSGSARSWLRRRADDDSGNKSNASSSYASSLRHSPISAVTSDSCASFERDETADPTDVETYSGEWKNDKRSGFGVAERTDGLKYEGEWENNKKHGYGATTFPDGSREEGKFKNDQLVTAGRKNKFMLLRTNKLKEHVDNAIAAAQRASQIASQKAEIAINRMGTARNKAEAAMQAAEKAQSDAERARMKAIEYAPDFMAELEKKCAATAVPLLGIPHLHSPRGGIQSHEAGHSSPLDAAASFVSQFTDHYNPQNQFQNAKTFLNKVTKAATVAVESAITGNDDGRLPLPSIGNALLSAGLESGLLKSLGQKPMQPLASSLRQSSTTRNTSNGNAPRRFEPHPSLSARNPSKQEMSGPNSARNSQREADKQRFQDYEVITNVPSVHLTSSNAPQATQDSPYPNAGFSQTSGHTVLDDHFDHYQVREEATTAAPSAKAPLRSAAQNPSKPSDGAPEPAAGSPFDLYQHQQQLQLQLQQQQQFLQQQQQQYLLHQKSHRYDENQFSGGTSFSYDNPRRPGLNPGYYEPSNRQARPGQFFAPTPSSYERRQTLPPGQLEEVIKDSLLQAGSSNRPKEAPQTSKNLVAKAVKDAMGSMPDVSRRKIRGAREEPAMAREEVHYMSMARREEIRRLREEEERRRQQELVLSFGEFRNWCHQRQLLVFLIAINLGLAAVFFNLLTR